MHGDPVWEEKNNLTRLFINLKSDLLGGVETDNTNWNKLRM